MAVIGGGAAALAARAGVRDDPYLGYGFLVEIQGLIAGGFTEVAGLSVHTEVARLREGGVNDRAHHLPGQSSYGDLVLRRGVGDLDLLWGWYREVIEGRVHRRNGTVYLLNHAGVPTRWWNFHGAYPVAWEGPTFEAASSTVLSQSLTLTHQGLTNPLAP